MVSRQTDLLSSIVLLVVSVVAAGAVAPEFGHGAIAFVQGQTSIIVMLCVLAFSAAILLRRRHA